MVSWWCHGDTITTFNPFYDLKSFRSDKGVGGPTVDQNKANQNLTRMILKQPFGKTYFRFQAMVIWKLGVPVILMFPSMFRCYPDQMLRSVFWYILKRLQNSSSRFQGL